MRGILLFIEAPDDVEDDELRDAARDMKNWVHREIEFQGGDIDRVFISVVDELG